MADVIKEAFTEAIDRHLAGEPPQVDHLCQLIMANEGDPVEAMQFLAMIAARVERFDFSAELLRRAVALNPDDAKPHYNLGVALQKAGRIDAAIDSYRQAIALRPEPYPQAHYNLAYALLIKGDLAGGFKEHEWRWQCADFAAPRRNFSQPQWDGRRLWPETLLIHAEQGFGDTIQFIRYLPMVCRQAERVIVECQPALKALLQPIASKCTLIA